MQNFLSLNFLSDIIERIFSTYLTNRVIHRACSSTSLHLIMNRFKFWFLKCCFMLIRSVQIQTIMFFKRVSPYFTKNELVDICHENIDVFKIRTSTQIFDDFTKDNILIYRCFLKIIKIYHAILGLKHFIIYHIFKL